MRILTENNITRKIDESFAYGLPNVKFHAPGFRVCQIDVEKETCSIDDGPWVPLKEQKTYVQGSSLRALPTPCQVHVEGEVFVVRDGVLEMDFDLPGSRQVKVVALGYKDWAGMVDG